MYNKAKNFKVKEVERKPLHVRGEPPKQFGVMKQSESVKQSKPVNDGIDSFLINIINSEKKSIENLLNNIETINQVTGEYIFKKKSNNKDYENKVKADEDKKEVEQTKMMKKLEEQISQVMNKVDTCLENAKNIGKIPLKKILE